MSSAGDARNERIKMILARQAARGLQAIAGVGMVAVGVGVELGGWWGLATAGMLSIVTSGYWRNWR